MRRRTSSVFALLFAAVLFAAPSHAAWSGNGLRLGPSASVSALGRVVASDAGGFLFVWGDLRTAKSELYAVHLDGDGVPPAGSSLDGSPIAARAAGLGNIAVVSDGNGGAFVAFIEMKPGAITAGPYLTHVLADGSRDPAFPEGGVLVGADPNAIVQPLVLFADAAGVKVGWQDGTTARFTRVSSAGVIATGWPAGGLAVFDFPYALQLLHAVSDGAGGAYLSGPDESDLVLRRLTSTGANASGWTTSGFRIPGGGGARTALLALPGGYVMVAFEGPGTGEPSGVRALRATPTGAVAGNWTIEGLAIADGYGPQLCSDGDLGAIIAWSTVSGFLRTQHVLATGTLDAAWPAAGCLMNGVTGAIDTPALEPDGAGGAFVAWGLGASDQRNVQGQHVIAGGALATGWAVDGVAISAAPGIQKWPCIASDGAGGMVAVWSDSRDPVDHAFAARVSANGIVPVLASLASASAEPGLVRLRWNVAGTEGFSGAIDRSENGGDWIERAQVRADASGIVEWSDADVSAGHTYAYRLLDDARQVLDEVTIAVPERSELALAGFRPNPPDDRFLLELSLATAGVASIDVIDVRGRRVARRDLAGLGAGRHRIALTELRALPGGLYFVSLTQDGRRVTTRLVRAE